ncbi:DNA primase [Parapedobacter koreensis]|uniref:DNA primase n=1 Tax=Parapedobacter koreensis TaxID=332977 RepID=A0A1H7QRI8_9SPHI|nr:DNA primase [Parapedobacter koreensis]SEL50328.1 DNA primase [Parapedobacter koreensis]
MIKQEVIDKIIDAARIEEVVGDFVDLKKRGTSLIGLCPFHNEKTPSFNVSVSKGIYKCFGCGAGGDSVRFVMEHEKYSYPEALKYLAQKYHIEVEESERTPEQLIAQNKRESLFIVTNWAGKFFKETLWDTEEGRAIGLNYFKERGYREDIIQKFELGYSPEAWTALYTKARAEGYNDEFLEATGLVIRKDDGSVYDRFRGRVMFPIHNLTGRILGFGGRTLKTDKKTPKYVNSPESEVYHKSDVLYGLYFAKKPILDADNCYLVEGYADVLSMHQAGVENVVASSGTSLTSGQIRLIARYTKNVTILYDGDEAGIKASLRGTDMLLEEGLNVKVLLFPDGNDPDSYVQRFGSAAFKNYIAEHQRDFIFYKTQVLLRDAGNDPVKRAAVIHDVVDSIALIPDAIKASVFVRECSTLLDIEERILIAELNKIRISQARKADRKPEPLATPADTSGPSPKMAPIGEPEMGASSDVLQEREIIRILLHYGDKLAAWEVDSDIPIAPLLLSGLSDLSFDDPVCLAVINIYKDYIAHNELPEERVFVGHADRRIADLAVDLLATKYSLSPNWNDEKRKIYVSHESERLEDLVYGAIYRIKKRKVEQQIYRIREELKIETDSANMELMLANYQKLKDISKLIADKLGTIVIK